MLPFLLQSLSVSQEQIKVEIIQSIGFRDRFDILPGDRVSLVACSTDTFLGQPGLVRGGRNLGDVAEARYWLIAGQQRHKKNIEELSGLKETLKNELEGKRQLRDQLQGSSARLSVTKDIVKIYDRLLELNKIESELNRIDVRFGGTAEKKNLALEHQQVNWDARYLYTYQQFGIAVKIGNGSNLANQTLFEWVRVHQDQSASSKGLPPGPITFNSWEGVKVKHSADPKFSSALVTVARLQDNNGLNLFAERETIECDVPPVGTRGYLVRRAKAFFSEQHAKDWMTAVESGNTAGARKLEKQADMVELPDAGVVYALRDSTTPRLSHGKSVLDQVLIRAELKGRGNVEVWTSFRNLSRTRVDSGAKRKKKL